MDYIRSNYRIYPTKEQVAFLNQEIGNQRFLWNKFLGLNIEKHGAEKKFIFFNEATGMLKQVKEEHEFLKLGDAQALQQTLRDLDVAIRSCFKSTAFRKGFPKFKKKDSSGSIRYPQRVSFIGDKLKIPKLGLIKITGGSKGLPTEFKSTTIIKKPSGKWYASFVMPYNLPEKVEITSDSRCVGVDLNSQKFVVTSNSEYAANPKHIKDKEKKLKRYQRRYSLCKKGSSNQKKARIKLARIYEKVANQRKDFVEKITNDIVNTYDIISIEDLNVKAMQKWNGRMIQSAPFSLFRSKLTWKANRNGKHLIVIDRYDPTSKMCNSCGTLHDMPVRERVMKCSCGNVIDRDYNAAKNILRFGLSRYIGWEPAEFTPPETLRLQGRSSAWWKSMKEETS